MPNQKFRHKKYRQNSHNTLYFNKLQIYTSFHVILKFVTKPRCFQLNPQKRVIKCNRKIVKVESFLHIFTNDS